MRGEKKHVVYLCIIFSYAIFLGILVDAWIPWTYTHAGSDTLKHLYKTKFLLDNWPNTQWNPQWAAGCPFLVTYPPFLYYLTSSSVQLLGISIEIAYISIIGTSYCLFGLGLYGFIFEIGKNKEVSVATAFLGISSPLIWRLHTRWGLGMDVCSLGFSALALWMIAKHTNNLNTRKPSERTYLLSVFFIALSIAFHSFEGVINLGLCSVILLSCVKGSKQKIVAFLKISIPAILINAYYFVRLVSHILSSQLLVFSTKATSDVVLRLLFGIPTYYADSLPLIEWPLIIVLSMLLLLYKKKGITSSQNSNENRFLLALIASTVLIIVFVWFRLSMWFYVFTLLPLYITSVNGILLKNVVGKTRTAIRHPRFSRHFSSMVSLILIVLILLVTISISHTSIIDKFTQLGKLKPKDEYQFEISKNEKMFRVGIAGSDGHLSQWFNYRFDTPQTRHYGAGDLLYPDWNYWFEYSVWSLSVGYEETNFLLDWWAVEWILVYDQGDFRKFLDQSTFYDFLNKEEAYYVFTYRNSTRIASATNVPSLLIIGNEAEYNNVFRSLAYSNFNSQHIIPVRGNEYIDDYTLDELEEFDTILLYGYSYHDKTKAWNLLEQYAENGGNLIIETGYSADIDSPYMPLPCPVDKTTSTTFGMEWDLTATDNLITEEVDFTSFSPPIYEVGGIATAWTVSASTNESVRQGAETLLWEEGHPLVVVWDYGEGRVVWSGLNLPYHIAVFRNSVESDFLSKTIGWASGPVQREAKEDEYSTVRPNAETLVVDINSNSVRGILFKEHYAKNWISYLVDAKGKREYISLYQAGPDFMFISLPKESNYPLTITFEYELTWVEHSGYYMTLVTSLTLIAYGVTPSRFHSAYSYLIRKMKKEEEDWLVHTE